MKSINKSMFNVLFFFVIVVGLAFSACAATTVTASGTSIASEPGAREIAVQHAQRAAVEQGLGSLIDSSTLTENYELISDRVYSASQGYVTKYDVLSEKTDGDILKVTIRAVVDTKSILNDVDALNIFQQQHFDNKRVLVLYKKKDNHSPFMTSDSDLVESVRSRLQEELMSKNFRVFDDEAVQRLNKKIMQGTRMLPDERLVKDAQTMGADILLVFNLTKDEKIGTPYSAASIRLQTKVYDASTGQLLARSEGEAKQLTKGSPGDDHWGEALVKAGIKAAKSEGPKLIEKIISRNSQSAGAGNASSAYELNFKNFSQNEMDIIHDTINAMKFTSYRVLSISSGLMRLEVFSDSGNTGSLQMQIRSALKKNAVQSELEQASGNKMIFKKAGM